MIHFACPAEKRKEFGEWLNDVSHYEENNVADEEYEDIEYDEDGFDEDMFGSTSGPFVFDYVENDDGFSIDFDEYDLVQAREGHPHELDITMLIDAARDLFPEVKISGTVYAQGKYDDLLMMYTEENDTWELSTASRCQECGEIVPDYLAFMDLGYGEYSQCLCSPVCTMKRIVDPEEYDAEDYEEQFMDKLREEPEITLNQDNFDTLLDICKDRTNLRAMLIDSWQKLKEHQ